MNHDILSFSVAELPTAKLHEYLLSTIAPRPVAWVSTINKNGAVNLSPFSFFNVFGSNPATIIFSPSRRVRDNTIKHTLRNVLEVDECVVNICQYSLVEQMVLSSAEFEDGINEFQKAGLTEIDSLLVKPPRVKEAIAQFECKVKQVISTGENGGAGQLVICEVIHLHLQSFIFDEEGRINPIMTDQVSRMGKLWYSRAKEGLFEVTNPKEKEGIGIDELPSHIKNSHILSGNDLAKLARIYPKPTINPTEVSSYLNPTGILDEAILHTIAKKLIEEGKTEIAYQILLSQD